MKPMMTKLIHYRVLYEYNLFDENCDNSLRIITVIYETYHRLMFYVLVIYSYFVYCWIKAIIA